MKVCLAGSGWEKLWLDDNFYSFFRLQTFFHISKRESEAIKKYDFFLLDSGAFSFFGKVDVEINKYIDDYINFINKHDIQYFFELDLYTLPEYGIKKTEEIRAYIEQKTGKQTIPVFHKMCGIEYYKKLCNEYKYIAIGASGMFDCRWTRSNPNQLKNMVLYARSKNVKVHGLGYTKIDMLKEIPFFSVDSTSWLSGNRFGGIYVFNGKGFDKTKKPNGTRIKNNETAKHNFEEWIKFQKYANTEF